MCRLHSFTIKTQTGFLGVWDRDKSPNNYNIHVKRENVELFSSFERITKKPYLNHGMNTESPDY